MKTSQKHHQSGTTLPTSPPLRRSAGRRALLAAALAGALATSNASALDLVMTFDSATSDSPSFDPLGAKLTGIMLAVEDTWESIILDNEIVIVTFYYETGTSGLANARVLATHPNGRPSAGRVRVDTDVSTVANPNREWFFDLTPETNEYWDMTQKIYREIPSAEQAARFNPSDTPPDVLEVSYRGPSNSSAPLGLQGNFDLYTSMLHEVGHILGMEGTFADPSDTEIETDRDFTGGNDFAALLRVDPSDNSVELGHFAWTTNGNNPLMCGSCAETDARRFPTAQDIICIASRAGWNTIDLPRVDFLGSTNADFNVASNWVGNRVPNSNNEVYCRHADRVKLIADATIKTLMVGSGTTFETEGFDLDVNGDVNLVDDQPAAGLARPFLVVEQGSLFEASDLNVPANTLVEIQDGSDLLVNDDFLLEGELRGEGTVEVADNFWNNGGIVKPRFDGLLVIDGTDGLINLDGQTPEDGTVECTQGDLEVKVPLADHFGSEITVGPGHYAKFPRGWTLGTNGTLTLDGGPDRTNDDRARILGEGNYLGTIEVDEEARLESDRVVADPLEGLYYLPTHTIEDGCIVSLPDSDDRLAFLGATIEAGAVFTGSGIVVNGEGGQLDLLDGADLGVKLTNGGNELRFNGAGTTGTANVLIMNFLEIGTARFDINDLPATSDYDHLSVDMDATLRGTLEVDFTNFPSPPLGTRWRIIQAGSASGVFTSVDIIGLNPLRAAWVEYFADGVDVVIGSNLVAGEIRDIIPGLSTVGTSFHFPLEQGQRPNFQIYSSNPEIVSVNTRPQGGGIYNSSPSLSFERAGTATLLIEVFNDDGTVDKSEVTINVGAAPACGLQAQLLDPAGQIDDHLGHSVALAGNIAISGAPHADPGGRADAGHAVIWERQAGAWVTVATVASGLTPGDRSGTAVELDGNLAFVGLPGRGSNSGEVRVFVRAPGAGGAWTPAAILQPPVAQPGMQFGTALEVIGNVVLVGAPGDNLNGVNAGAVYLFERTAPGTWTPRPPVRGSDTTAGDFFGLSLANGAGQIVVGAPGRSGGTGAAYRFTNASGSFIEQDILTAASGAAGDGLGWSLAIGPGPVLLAGAPTADDPAASNSGSVTVFEPVGGTWSETGSVALPGPGTGDGFGWALTYSDCGFLASAPWRDEIEPDAGTVHAIGFDGTKWVAGGPLTPPDLRPGDRYGFALAGDGPCYLAGARLDDDLMQDAGSVYVWCEGAGSRGNIFDPTAANRDPELWLKTQFPENFPGGDLRVDDDGDGKSRFWEYLQGGSALGQDSPAEFVERATGQQVRYRMKMARRALGRYHLVFEQSGDGKFWRQVPAAPAVIDTGGDTVDIEWPAVPGRDRTQLLRVRVDGFQPEGLAWSTDTR